MTDKQESPIVQITARSFGIETAIAKPEIVAVQVMDFQKHYQEIEGYEISWDVAKSYYLKYVASGLDELREFLEDLEPPQ